MTSLLDAARRLVDAHAQSEAYGQALNQAQNAYIRHYNHEYLPASHAFRSALGLRESDRVDLPHVAARITEVYTSTLTDVRGEEVSFIVLDELDAPAEAA